MFIPLGQISKSVIARLKGMDVFKASDTYYWNCPPEKFQLIISPVIYESVSVPAPLKNIIFKKDKKNWGMSHTLEYTK